MKKRRHLSKQEIEKAIFEGVYPTRTIKIPPLTLILVINDKTSLPRNIEDWLNFFENACFIPGFQDSRVFLREVPFSFFEKLVREYIELYNNWMLSILLHMSEIVDEPSSKMTWCVFTKAPANKVLSIGNRLNAAQYYWIVFNTIEDKKDLSTLITDLFEAAKPWLNTELWSRVKDAESGEGSGRLNRFYEDQIRKFDEKAGLVRPREENEDVDIITMETK